MSSIDEKLEELSKKEAKKAEKKRALIASKRKQNDKYESRAIKILGRISLANLDVSKLKDYCAKARKAEKELFIECIAALKPDLKQTIDEL